MPSVCIGNNMSSTERTAQLDNTSLNMEFLELAGRSLDMRIVADNASSSFVEMTGVASQHTPTVSGLNDFDYQSLSGQVIGHQALSQLKTLSKVPLPPEVLEHFGHMQCHCMMGLFPEINRGWLTIDSNIYVWAYEHGTDVAYFDGLGETIVSVGLIKPKPGVFQNFVKYLLILTTTVEIVVLGVTFSSGSNNGPLGVLEEMHLVPEPVFVLPTDGVSMNVIQSTNTGRIFMGGKDGCLYEITYQAQLGWFGKHCKKVNHSTGTLSFLVPTFLNVALYEDDPVSRIDVDNSRGILYTLSEKGAIEVFDLGAKGDYIKKVVKLSQSKIVHMATDIVKTLESANFRPIIAISAIEESESQHLNVIAITQCGVRLYFTAGCVFVSGNGIASQRPWCLTLLHVRLPPGFAANAPMIRPKQVHTATYSNGTALLISTASADSELLWCLSGGGVAVSGGSTGREVAAILSLDGPAWALRKAASPLSNLSPALQLAAEPSIVSQHMSGSIKWVVLTGTGAHIIQQLLPVDVLRQLLIESQGCDSPQVKSFFQMQREDQACASCLVLACAGSSSSGSTQEHIAEWATRAYFLYGGQPTLLQHQSLNFPGSPQFAPRQMSTPMVGRSAANVHQSLQAALQSPDGERHHSPGNLNRSVNFNQTAVTAGPRQPNPGQENIAFPTMHFSPKHEGLYIYVGRILRPLWQLKCVSKSTVDTKDFLSSTVTSGDCDSVLQHLYGVRAFLERNSVGSIGQMPRSAMISGPHQNDSNLNMTRQEDIFMKEKQSLDALRVFINGSCEMLSLWKILCEHQFHVIAACLPPDQQSALLAASFRELLLGGQEVAGLLILSLINQYLTDNASVDSISSELRDVCPNLYRREDAACSKANEILLFAKQQSSTMERDEMLCNALKLCRDVAPHVNLPVVCAKFSQAGFYKGVVDLCVTCADKIDPTKTGLHFYRNNQPSHDQEGYLAFYKRMDVYREVTGVLEQLFEQSSGGSSTDGLSGATTTTTPTKSPSAPQDLPNLSPADANYQARKLVIECLTYPDELLHVAVYEWMLTKQLYGELISVAEPSLESFLIRTSQNNPDAVHVFDLLWKYYEKCGNHAAAARILDNLASKQSSNMKLTQRVNWLSRAVVCLRGGAGASPGAGRLLRELEEKAEVARLQRLVLSAIVRLPSVPNAAVLRLENALLDITQLYEEFADKYDLWECKLAIVHCSGHNDPLLVESIWTNIIQQELDNSESHTSNDNRMIGLLSKISSLGKEYVGSGPCFPLSFILRQLELQTCRLKVNPGLVSETLLDINVPMEQLIDIYTRLIGLNERVWLSEGYELHLIEAAAILMDHFANNSVPLSAHLRRKVLIKCQDLVSSSLNSLYTKPDTDSLIQVLKGIQTKFERME